VPLTAGGKLNIVASADLGALGTKAGTPMVYDWVVPGIAPLLLPWLVILVLLALKPNRNAAAWLIWLPLGCVYGFTLAPPVSLPAGTNFFLDAIAALAVGLAAVWLLAYSLRQKHRLVTFFIVLFALAGFSGLAAVARQGLSLSSLGIESMQTGILLGIAVLVSAVALSLSGWISRRRYRPLGLYLWLFLLLLAIWLMIALPFFLLALATNSVSLSWSELFFPVMAVAAGHFATLLPFLVLSSASPLFRERLKALLQVPPVPPPVMNSLPEAGLKI